MRVLMLAQFYPPAIGGEERHVRSLGQALVARGHDVAVATLWHPGLAEFELDGDVRIYRVRGLVQRLDGVFTDGDRRHAPPIADPETVLGLAEVLRIERPSIIHAHNWLVHSFVPLKAWSDGGLVVTLHDFGLVCPTKNLMRHGTPCPGPSLRRCTSCTAGFYGPVKGAITQMAHRVGGALEQRAVDMFLPVSDAVAEGCRLEERGLPFRVVPNFILDNVAEPPAPPSPLLDQLPSEPYLLYVGTLTRIKGVNVLLEAYAGLEDAPPLVLIGLATQDTPVTLPHNVTVIPNLPHSDVIHAWKRSLFGVVPSICPDACPTVAMEAMASGKPVVGSDIGGIPDIVEHGRSGLVVPPDDVHALRGALKQLIDDRELVAEMGVEAQERATAFMASSVVPGIERVYRAVAPKGVVAAVARRLPARLLSILSLSESFLTEIAVPGVELATQAARLAAAA